MVAAAKSAGVRRFIQMSALGAQANPSYPYLQAKRSAEDAVSASGLDFTIIRPSVIFGPGDGFINVLANLVRKAPVIPILGDGQSRFQPVAVNDVADCFARTIDDAGTIGQTYEVGGGEIYSYAGLLDLLQDHLKIWKREIHIPVGVMKAVLSMTSPLPKSMRPPVTKEQVRMLALNNTTDHNATEALINRKPIALRDGLDYIQP